MEKEEAEERDELARGLTWLAVVGSVSPLMGLLAPLPSAAADSVFQNLDGRSRTLASLSGRVPIVNFWATWCGPCIEEMPLLAAVAREYADRGVKVVAISADDETTVARVTDGLPVFAGDAGGSEDAPATSSFSHEERGNRIRPVV